MQFTRPPREADSPKSHSGTFDLLGFTHYWRRSRRGHWVVYRKTAKDRYVRTRKAINQWCRANRHRPMAGQWLSLCRKLEGHYCYFGIPGNVRQLAAAWCVAHRRWRYWLARRSQRGRMPWSRFQQLLARYPLPPRVCRPVIARSEAIPRGAALVNRPRAVLIEGRAGQPVGLIDHMMCLRLLLATTTESQGTEITQFISGQLFKVRYVEQETV